MKKNVVRVLALVLVALMCLSLVPLAAHAEGHVHFYEPTRIEPTCSEDGYIQMICEACGDGGQILEYIPPTGLHSFINVEDPEYLIHEGDCEHAFQYWKSCSVCLQSAEEAYNKALDEMYDELNNRKNSGEEQDWETLIKNRVLLLDEKYKFSIGGEGHHYIHVDRQEATCTSDGWKEYSYCDVCGEYFNFEAIPAKGHRWGEYTQTKAPTCTEDGSRERVCEVCDVKDVEAIPALGHSWGEFTVTKAPNCTEDGTQERVCAVCGEKDVQVIPALGHRFGAFTVTRPATCTVDGEQEHVCTVCGFKETEVIPAAHKWGEFVVVEEPTCYASGTQERSCTVCGEKERESIPAAHKWGEFVVTMEPTCYSTGERRSTCTVCGESHVEWIDMVDHKYENGECVWCHAAMPEGYVAPAAETNEPETTEPETTEPETTEPETAEPETPVTEPVNEIPANAIYITFDGNGATGGSMADQPFAPGAVQALSVNAFTREGYEFLGWDVAADGSAMGEDRFLDGEAVELNENVTLYAQWKQSGDRVTVSGLSTGESAEFGAGIGPWTVFFNANGGSPTPPAKTGTDPFKLPKVGDVIRQNHTLMGWNTNQYGNGTHYDPDELFTPYDDMTLYAEWDIRITYLPNGGEGDPMPSSPVSGSNVELTYNDIAGAPIGNQYTRPGYTFIGWNTKADGSGTSYEETQTITAPTNDVELFAQWAKNTAMVSFDAHGGTNIGSGMPAKPVDWGDTLTLDSYDGRITPPEGKRFKYWTVTNEDIGKHYTDGQVIPAKEFTDDTILYAQWEADNIVISYYKNAAAATGTMAADTVQSHQDAPIKALAFDNPGYVFIGWAVTAAGPVKYADNVSVIPASDVIANIDLYAVWKEQVTVTFKANNGTAEADRYQSAAKDNPKNLTSIGTIGFTAPDYKVFNGWNTAADGSGTPYEDGAVYPFGEPVTLYAQWKPIELTVTFDANNGTGSMAPQTFNMGEAFTLNKNEETAGTFHITRDRYEFIGWNTLKEPSAINPGVAYTDGGNVPANEAKNNIKLYAQWKQVKFTVTFNSNGSGETETTQEIDTTTGASSFQLDANPFTKEKWIFTGWNTKADGTGTPYSEGQVIPASDFTGDLVLYAQWMVAITFDKNNDEATGTMEPQEIELNKKVQINKMAFESPYWTFNNWNTKADGTGNAYADEADITTDTSLTLYAQWVKTSYAIRYEKGIGGGSPMAEDVVEKGKAGIVKECGYTAPDLSHVFGGWLNSADGKLYQPGDSIETTLDGENPKHVTLTAQWMPKITITFDPGTGTGATQTQIVPGGVEMNLKTLTELGYTAPEDFEFECWTVEGDTTTTYQDGDKVTLSADKKLIAKWKQITFTVTFKPGAASGTDKTQKITDGKDNELMANPFTYNKFEFTGWKDQDGKTYADKEHITEVTKDLTMTAQWKQVTFTVTFKPGAAPGTDRTQDITDGKDNVLMANPFTYDKFEFTGWKDQDGKTYTDEEHITKVTKDLTLTAQWKQVIFEVTFQPGTGATGYMAKQRIKNGEDTPLNKNAFSWYNHRFKEWSGSDGETYTDEQTITTITADLTLTAQWYELATITFVPNNGLTDEPKTQTEIKNNPEHEALNTLAELGFKSPANKVFNGWNTVQNPTPENPGIWYGDGTTNYPFDTDGARLYAQWDPIVVTIKLEPGTDGVDVDGGMADLFVNAGDTIKLTKFDPTKIQRNHYSFTGWNTKADGTGKAYADEATITVPDTEAAGKTTSKTITLYAQWKQTTFTINYAPNGGSKNGDPDARMEKSELDKNTETELTLRPNEYTREHYTFMGWNTEEDGSGTDYVDKEVIPAEAITKDMTIYAQWETVIVFDKNDDEATGTMDPQEVTFGEDTIIDANEFVKSNYTFDHWNTKADDSGKSYANQGTIPADELYELDNPLTLYAQWLKTNYFVNYDKNKGGGETMTPNIIHKNTSGIVKENEYTAPNATMIFVEWNTKADGTGVSYAPGDKIETVNEEDPRFPGDTERTIPKDITLYAIWADKLTVWFYPGTDEAGNEAGGTTQPVEIPKGYAFGMPSASSLGFTAPSSDETFEAWRIVQTVGGKEKTDVVLVGDIFTFTPDTGTEVRVFGKWKESVKVTYNANGGTMSPNGSSISAASDKAPKDSPYKLRTQEYLKLERKGYTFLGWALGAGASEPRKDDKEDWRRWQDEDHTISNEPILATEGFSQDTTIYAVWQQDAFEGIVTITGSVTDMDPQGLVGETLTADVANETKFFKYHYQWLRDGVEIEGATDQTYVVTAYDYDHRITCRVKAEDASPDTKLSVNYKDIELEDIYKEIDIVDNAPEDEDDYFYGLTENMSYTLNSTDPKDRKLVSNPASNLTIINGVLAFQFTKQGTYRFYNVVDKTDLTKGSLIATVVVRNWFSLDYEITNRVTTTTTSSGSKTGSGSSSSGSSSSSSSSSTSSTTGTGTVQMKNGNTVLSASSSIKDKSGNVIIKGNGTNAWLVREGANTDLKMTVRPASNSYGFVYLNGSQLFSTNSERTMGLGTLTGPEHYDIVFVNATSSPKTADTSNLGLWSALGFVSFVGLTSILVSGRKRRNRG